MRIGNNTVNFSPPPTCFRFKNNPSVSPSPHQSGFMGMHAVPEKGQGMYRMSRPMRIQSMELEHEGQQFTAHISAAGTRISTAGGETFELADAQKQFGFSDETIAMLDMLSQAKAHMHDNQPSVYMEHRLMEDGTSWFSASPTNEQRTPNFGESSTTFLLRDSLEQATNAFASIWGASDADKETMITALRFLIGGAGVSWLMRIELDRLGENNEDILNFDDLPQSVVDQMRTTSQAQEDRFIETFVSHFRSNGSVGAFSAAWSAMHAIANNNGINITV